LNLKFCWLILGWIVAVPAANAGEAAWYIEQEQGGDPYSLRMIATRDFLRIDDGVDQSGFLLYDRNRKLIQTVSHEERTVLVIRGRPVDLPQPPLFVQRVEKEDLQGAPSISGKKVLVHRFLTNGKACGEVAAVPGLLPELVAALKEYFLALAGEQAVTAKLTPPEQQNDCELAEFVFYPDRHLQYGLPVNYRGSTGRRQSLEKVDADFKAGEQLFRIPPDYQQLTPEDIRGGS